MGQDGDPEPRFMWLLKYEEGFYGNCSVIESLLYSTKAKASAAFPNLMDKRCQFGSDWRNGLRGFGKEKDKNYLGLECFVDNLGDEGGDLLTNKRIDSRDTITISLTRMQVDPLNPKPKFQFDVKNHTTARGAKV
ncbi:hypothetical protein ACHAXA_011058 [Cyclostephanos tholiformis]|uniref:Uncharacterized protein n=1 Tax=Cyclostephanos tholiformis TaxID=382380 RepID=A0ABD3RYW9_9STRA